MLCRVGIFFCFASVNMWRAQARKVVIERFFIYFYKKMSKKLHN